MTSSRIAACLVLAALVCSCQPASDQTLTTTERSAITESVSQVFDGIAAATNALDFDRLLGYYREREDLTYVARGRVTRSYPAFADLVHAQFRGITAADLQWVDTYIDVLTREVAVATATYRFAVTLESGDTARSQGTFMAIAVLREGEWQIDYSSHTFPLADR